MARAVRLKPMLPPDTPGWVAQCFEQNKLYFLYEFGPITELDCERYGFISKRLIGRPSELGKILSIVVTEKGRQVRMNSDQWYIMEQYFHFIELCPSSFNPLKFLEDAS